MNRTLKAIGTIAITVIISMGLVSASALRADAAPAGSYIDNLVVLQYTYPTSPVMQVSASDSFLVHELLAHTLVWLDAAPVPVQTGDSQQVITYEINNAGNGFDEYSLILNSSIVGDDFDPFVSGVYLDINNSGSYDAGDLQYLPLDVSPQIAPGESLRVFVVANIPSSLPDGSISTLELSAISNTVSPTAAVGDIIAGAGDGGSDVVVSLAGGSYSSQASFSVITYLTIVKSATVISSGGGTRPEPGAAIEYTVTVTLVGAGPMDNLVITDPVPANTTYLPGSIYVNGSGRTDAADGDGADYGATSAGTVTVDIGTMTNLNSPQEIRFSVTID